MNRHARSPRPYWVKFLAGCTAVFCCFPAVAVAQLTPSNSVEVSGRTADVIAQYRGRTGGPPPRAPRSGVGRNGSCTRNTETTLTALAPYSHTGTTRSLQPTFAWYVPDSQPLSLEFRLYVYEADGYLDPQPLYRTIQGSKTGIMALTLPSEVSLSPGKTYYWQVALLCNPAFPSENLVVGADIQVVDSATSDDGGLWYDKLNAELDSESLSSGSTAIDQAGLELLADLATIERTMSETLATQAQAVEETESEALQEMSIQLLKQSEQLMNVITVERE